MLSYNKIKFMNIRRNVCIVKKLFIHILENEK
jgi:hypothetical protein